MFQSPDARSTQPASADAERDVLTRLAREHLSPGHADRWVALLRPAIALTARTGDARPVAVLGGHPQLPAGAPWPVWPGKGPLTFIGELDLGAAATFPLDVDLPATGRLLFFYFDGTYDDFANPVGPWDPTATAGAQLLYVPHETQTATATPPDGVPVLRRTELTGRATVTAPGWETDELRAAFDATHTDIRQWLDHPVNGPAFTDALAARGGTGPRHQVGGHPAPVQGPVETEVAWGVLGGGNLGALDRAAVAAEAARWRLIFQVDTDDDVGAMWGDCGSLYWLARADDLAAGDLAQASFTWQCT